MPPPRRSTAGTKPAAAPPKTHRSPDKRTCSADWEAIERDYRTGKPTTRELSAKYGPSHSAISRRAKAENWQKDLRAVIRDATAAAVIRESVATAAIQDATETVRVAAEIGKDVILRHRSELRDARTVANELLAELKAATRLAEHRELLVQIIAGEGAEASDIAAARSAVAKALGLGSRVTSIKALADALTKLHTAERQAFDLDDTGESPPPLAEALAGFVGQIHGAGAGRIKFASRTKT